MRIQPLASGSKGNSTLIRAGETNILVDLGFSARRAFEKLEAIRVSPQHISAIVVTHGHLDHTRGVGTFAKKSGAEVVCAEAVMKNSAVRKAKRFRALEIEGAIVLGTSDDALLVEAFQIPHDADPTVALRLTHGERRIAFVTDMGVPVGAIAERLSDAHVLVLEFNHDEALLANGPYPEPLKRRISGSGGHLSNTQAAWMLERMAGPDLHTVVLAHLSDTNNDPDLARAAAQAALDQAGRGDVRVLIAEQGQPLDSIDV